eukprot:7382984-Prymnesium_polylepis.1
MAVDGDAPCLRVVEALQERDDRGLARARRAAERARRARLDLERVALARSTGRAAHTSARRRPRRTSWSEPPNPRPG